MGGGVTTCKAFAVGAGSDDEAAGRAVFPGDEAGAQLQLLQRGITWHALHITHQVEYAPSQGYWQRLEDELGIIQTLQDDYLC